MASMKLSITLILLLSALVVLGEIRATEAKCAVKCNQREYITCDNYSGKKLEGCECKCAPKDGKNCVVHLHTGSTSKCGAQAPAGLGWTGAIQG